MNSNISWIILDAWGVIYRIGQLVDNILIPFIKNINPEINDLLIYQEYYKASKGRINSITFWTNIGFEKLIPKIEIEYLENISVIDKDFYDFAKKIKQKYLLALLTNDVEQWAKMLLNKYGIYKIFDKIVISGEVGYRKPEKEIFNILLSQINTPPSNCIFVDDTMKNLYAGAEIELNTIRFLRKDSIIASYFEFEVNNFTELYNTITNFF